MSVTVIIFHGRHRMIFVEECGLKNDGKVYRMRAKLFKTAANGSVYLMMRQASRFSLQSSI